MTYDTGSTILADEYTVEYNDEQSEEYVECKLCNSGMTEHQVHAFLTCNKINTFIEKEHTE